MTIHPYGDRAVLINFEQIIDPKINAKVIAIHQKIKASDLAGITFSIPAYCSLTIGFDPQIISYDQLCKHIAVFSNSHSETELEKGKTLHKIPVCYEAEFALDMEDVVSITALTRQEIIDLHTQNTYQVFMIGFLPGFGYMGRLSEKLYCRRKAVPRKKVPALSVGLAGFQTGIYPSEAPGGWQIIGRTPIKIFDPKLQQPFLFKPGDRVEFYPISKPTYFQIIENGK